MLVVPPIVIGAGWFILARHVGDVFLLAPFMVVTVNAVMAMPFVVRAIRPAHDAAAERHDRLAASLGISGWNRFRLIDWPSIRRPLLTGFAFAMALSLGDLGVIALFGSDAVKTLPFLLLERMGSYRTADAAGLALIVAVLCLGLMAAADRFAQGAGNDATQQRSGACRFASRTSRSAMARWRCVRRRVRSRRHHRGHRAERLRQVDAAQSDRRLRDAASRPRADRRRGRDGAAAVGAAGVDDLPGEQSVRASRRRGECRARDLAGAAAVAAPTASRIATALERTGLAGKEKRLPRELSGGERQRVALARALVRDRPVLLLDEPFASLGPALRDEMLDLLVSVQAERRMTTLLVTHQPEDARRVADSIVFLEAGRIVAAGRQAVVLRRKTVRRRSGATSDRNHETGDHVKLPGSGHNLRAMVNRGLSAFL